MWMWRGRGGGAPSGMIPEMPSYYETTQIAAGEMRYGYSILPYLHAELSVGEAICEREYG